MNKYENVKKEELIQQVINLEVLVSQQLLQIKNLEKKLDEKEKLINKLKQRKKAGRKETPKDIKFQAYMMHGQGKSYREISKILGISIGTISNIIKGGLHDDEE